MFKVKLREIQSHASSTNPLATRIIKKSKGFVVQVRHNNQLFWRTVVYDDMDHFSCFNYALTRIVELQLEVNGFVVPSLLELQTRTLLMNSHRIISDVDCTK